MPPTPLSHWIGFHLLLLLLLGTELIVARRRGPTRTHGTAIFATILWISAALAFAGFVYHTLGGNYALQYVTGYSIEEALSIDNLFVFLLLFRIFRIESNRQPKVLFWGVAGAIVLRGAFIAAGLGLLERFHWISYLFGAILLIAAVRLLQPDSNTDPAHCPGWLKWITRISPVSPRQDKFFVRENGRPFITVLFLALLAIELTDVVFALDSIPAVLSITRHPFLAYTSNIMAVMGLRSLYFLLIAMLRKLRWMHFGLAALLAFAALKMLLTNWIDLSPLASLGIILTILALTVIASLLTPAKPSTELSS